MNPVLYRSQAYPFVPGAQIPVALQFMEASKKMTAPVLHKVLLRVKYDVNTGKEEGGPGFIDPAYLSELFLKVQLTDIVSDRVNLRGSSLFVANQQEHGLGMIYNGPWLPTGVNNILGEFFLELTFHPRKCRRRNDYGLPIPEFLDGGQINLNLSARTSFGPPATGITVNSASVEVWSFIAEERKRELKSRMCLVEQDISQTDFNYPVGGKLRFGLAWAGEVAWDNGTPWVPQNIISRNLDYQAFPSTVLQRASLLESYPATEANLVDASGTVVQGEPDLTKQGFVIPIQWPALDQKVGAMFEMNAVQYKTDLGAIVTTDLPKMILNVVTERQEQASARTLGAQSMQDLAKAIATRSMIKTSSYGTDPSDLATTWAPQVAKYLPIRLKPPMVKK